ncbi:MAG: hypothetical protein IKF80_01775 [Erysipelotrichaceae bacterium]|nr:hypothetical protein [Erysipelotrichaceae bacterium]
MAKTEQPFSVLINSLIGDYYHANRDISDKTEKLGQRVSVRNIQRYRSSQSIPQYGTARLIVEAAGGTIDSEELKRSLELERNLQNEILEKDEVLIVKVSNKMLNEKLEKDDYGILDIVKQRAETIYPNDKRALEQYVCDLIAKDIYEDIV